MMDASQTKDDSQTRFDPLGTLDMPCPMDHDGSNGSGDRTERDGDHGSNGGDRTERDGATRTMADDGTERDGDDREELGKDPAEDGATSDSDKEEVGKDTTMQSSTDDRIRNLARNNYEMRRDIRLLKMWLTALEQDKRTLQDRVAALEQENDDMRNAWPMPLPPRPHWPPML